MASAIWRARSAASRRRRSASARAAIMRSRLDICRQSLRETFSARSSLRSRREAWRSFRPRRASAARSRLDWRESRRDEASARPRLPFEAAAFAAAFLDALDAALAEGVLKRMIVEMANATRLRERNFRVIELFLA